MQELKNVKNTVSKKQEKHLNTARDNIKHTFWCVFLKKTGNKFAYNFVEGNFETLDVNQKDKKYWVGYIAQQLSNFKQEKIQFKNEEMTM